MRCLEKGRSRRYETANALSRDVQRYLADEPVEARPSSLDYRLRKFVRKHRGAVTAASLVVSAVFVGAAVATWQAVRATDAEQEALDNARDATAARIAADRSAAAATKAADDTARLAEKRRVEIYPPRIKLAWQHWTDGDLVRMREALDSLRPTDGQSDLRGFEWHYLWRLAHHRHRTFHHPHPVRAVAAAPDGKTVATAGGGDGEVWVWDTATGAVRLRLTVGSPVAAVAYAPDGSALAAAGEAGTVRTWDPRTGEARLTLTGPGKPVGSLAYSADGSRLAAAVGGWTLKTGNPTQRFLPAEYRTPGPITVWDARTGRSVASLPGHPWYTLCLAFGPDGRSLASGGADGTLRVWDVDAGKQRFQVKDDRGGVFAVAYAQDGRTLVSAGWEMTARVRDGRSGALTRVLSGSTGTVLALAMSPDGREVLTAGFDRLVRRWDLATGRETGRILGHTLAATGLAADAGWRTVYTAGWDGDVHAWPADQPQECDRLGRADGGPIPSYHVAFSPDSSTLAASWIYEVVLYDPDTRRDTRVLTATAEQDMTIAFSPNGKLFAVVGSTGRIHRWDAETWAALPTIAAHPVKIWALAFSPDSRMLATAAGMWNRPGEVKVWDPVTGVLLTDHDPTSKTVRSVAFTPDSRTLLYGVGSRIGRLDVPSRTLLPDLPGLFHVALSRDGTTAVLGRTSPIPNMPELLEMDLWDVSAGLPRARLRGHTAEIYQAVFSPDGKTVATASWDGTVKLWHAATGEELLTFRRQVGVIWSVAFAPNGHYMAVGAGTLGVHELTLWDARPVKP
ncbi:MAG TPA: WD40 repeat domain-containing protein [Gemmataceae bacterium]|nr:WD40 repeat domain-containing protein [Gemmataceae bacterium]